MSKSFSRITINLIDLKYSVDEWNIAFSIHEQYPDAHIRISSGLDKNNKLRIDIMTNERMDWKYGSRAIKIMHDMDKLFPKDKASMFYQGDLETETERMWLE